jgi:hypothetical protein
VNPSPFQSRLRITETPLIYQRMRATEGRRMGGAPGPCGKPVPATEESQFRFTRQVVLNCPFLLFYWFPGRGSQSGGVHGNRGTCMHDFRLRAEAMIGGCTAVRGICCDEVLLSLNGAGMRH